MKQTPAPRKIREAMIHSGFLPHSPGRTAAGAARRAVRAPGRVNPELEPTDDEIEAELNTMLGAPAAAAALADVKQEA